jgi:hypothetical protein
VAYRRLGGSGPRVSGIGLGSRSTCVVGVVGVVGVEAVGEMVVRR